MRPESPLVQRPQRGDTTMKKFGGIVALSLALAAGIARAQEAENNVFADSPSDSSASAPAEPESSAKYYPRDRSRYDKSKSAAHVSRAEFEANERTRRLAAMRWYGMS